MKIRPLGTNILVQLLDEEAVLSSGIIIPENARDVSQRGKVLAVGEFVEDIKENDVVVFKKWRGDEFKVESNDCLMLDMDDVLALWKEI